MNNVDAAIHRICRAWDPADLRIETSVHGTHTLIHAYLDPIGRVDARTVRTEDDRPDPKPRRPRTGNVDTNLPAAGICICGHPTWTVIDGTPMHPCCHREGARCEPCRISRDAAKARTRRQPRRKKAA